MRPLSFQPLLPGRPYGRGMSDADLIEGNHDEPQRPFKSLRSPIARRHPRLREKAVTHPGYVILSGEPLAAYRVPPGTHFTSPPPLAFARLAATNRWSDSRFR